MKTIHRQNAIIFKGMNHLFGIVINANKIKSRLSFFTAKTIINGHMAI